MDPLQFLEVKMATKYTEGARMEGGREEGGGGVFAPEPRVSNQHQPSVKMSRLNGVGMMGCENANHCC